ncbi:hypothetical protein PVAP13_1NG457200 [Panicum virgatum]|uniref:Uncharacterized protein n=1 Tax=Panicum virgatum TaxID=38727 RepID=A0A8T0WUN3_PANVG|nr:hypothetical protein PVAP13_1NG457200 [Panicum virgatum]
MPFQSAALLLLQRGGRFREEARERSSSSRKGTKERESAGGEPRGMFDKF